MGTAIARMQQVTQAFERARPKIEDVLPAGVDLTRLMRTAQMAISGSPALLKCTTESLLVAFMETARLGLEVGGPIPGAHIVPFGTKATVIVDYRGLLDLAYRAGSIIAGQARVVYEGDKFDYEYGLDEYLTHKPCRDDSRGELTHTYCILTLPGGIKIFEVMGRTEIEKIRRSSKGAAKPDSPWVQWYERQALKSVVRYTVNRWVRKDPTVRDAIAIDTRTELGRPAPKTVDEVGDIPIIPGEPVAGGTEAVLDRMRERASYEDDVAEMDRLLMLAVQAGKLDMEEAEIWEEAKNNYDREGSPEIVSAALLTLRERLGTEV